MSADRSSSPDPDMPPLDNTDNNTPSVAAARTSKTDSSMYYYFKSTPADQAHKFQPQKVDSAAARSEESKSSSSSSASAGNGASAWNVAGTWEERDMTKWAEHKIKEVLVGYEFPGSFERGTIKINEVKKVEGHASIIFVRGKKKVGYEFKIEASWIGENGEENVSGTIELPDVSDYDTDFEVGQFHLSCVWQVRADVFFCCIVHCVRRIFW
eukprot:TRINITY_DN871_c0_g1_i1.p1 TRINITY_DN871_c0_g1~~TRINITY_DN871_c0_g1_i1.p1  ORF type:complete len:212 (+),score=41.18 TRINITY_DN871_c0_g1_i1:50-685(+)